MRYPELEAAIAAITSTQGPFPLREETIGGRGQRVFGGLPDSLRDLYAFAATYGDKDEFDQSQAEGFVKLWGMPFIK